MSSEIQDRIEAFHGRRTNDENHRFRSWEHCFGHFRNRSAFTTPQHVDTACLHLAFYLASWGMYRGKSKLLWKDYRIHEPAVSALLAETHVLAWNPQYSDPNQDSATIDAVICLGKMLKELYCDRITYSDGTPVRFEPTDTLITKILLGTTASTPACDRLLKIGLEARGLECGKFGKEFLKTMLNFYRAHATEFHAVQNSIQRQCDVYYPVMKLVDMYFWEVGRNVPQKDKKSSGLPEDEE